MANQTRLSRLIGLAGIAVGLWLMLSPVILQYASFNATAQQTIIGLIITLVAGVRVSLPTITWPSWIAIILGIQLIILPLALTAAQTAIQWNATLTGLVLLGLAGYSLSIRHTSIHHDRYIPKFR